MLVTSINDFICVPITPEMEERAKISASVYKNMLTNSLRSGKGTYAGELGEEIVRATYPFLIEEENPHYDFYRKMPDGTRQTYDVKTKERSVPPKLHYECSVNKLNGVQECDGYIFVSVIPKKKIGWILGGKSHYDFWSIAKPHSKGEKDNSNNFSFHCETYNMFHYELNVPPRIS